MNRIALLILFILAGCGPSRIALDSPEAPPPGRLWAGQEAYGYTDVYATADVLPRPVVGVSAMLQDVCRMLAKSPCAERNEVSLQMVIDEQGEVIGVHTEEAGDEACETVALLALQRFPHEPAMLNGEPVKMTLRLPVRFRQAARQKPPQQRRMGVKRVL